MATKTYMHNWSLSEVLKNMPKTNGVHQDPEDTPESSEDIAILIASRHNRARATSAPPIETVTTKRRRDITVTGVRASVMEVYKNPLNCDDSSDDDDSMYQTEPKRFKYWVKSLTSTQFKIYHDPVHGTIEVHPLLVTIINTRVFDRLKDIKQLGGVYYVYPGATHTRFEHSLGSCHIAGEYVKMLKSKQPELGITEKDVLRVQIAALCSSLGYGPFSKLFKREVLSIHYEGQVPENLKVPKLSALILRHCLYADAKIKGELKQYGLDEYDIEVIAELIHHSDVDGSKQTTLFDPKQEFLKEIVTNRDTGIDVAKWDFLARDCHYLGIPNEFDWRRLMALSRVIQVDDDKKFKICYRDKAMNNIYGMFRTRCNLHERVYKHHAVVAVEHMIGSAILKVKETIMFQSGDADHEKKLWTVKEAIEKLNVQAEELRKCDLEGYLALTDSIVPTILNTAGSEENLNTAQKTLQNLKERHIMELVCECDSTHITRDFTNRDLGKEYADDDNVYVMTVHISYESERSVQQYTEQNPVKRVYFYSKKTPWKAEKIAEPNQKSNIMTPTTFITRTTRLYASREKSDAEKKEIKKKFEEMIETESVVT